MLLSVLWGGEREWLRKTENISASIGGIAKKQKGEAVIFLVNRKKILFAYNYSEIIFVPQKIYACLWDKLVL